MWFLLLFQTNVILVDVDYVLILFSLLVFKLDLAKSWTLVKVGLVDPLAVKEAHRFALTLLLSQCLWVQSFWRWR